MPRNICPRAVPFILRVDCRSRNGPTVTAKIASRLVCRRPICTLSAPDVVKVVVITAAELQTMSRILTAGRLQLVRQPENRLAVAEVQLPSRHLLGRTTFRFSRKINREKC